MQEIDRIWLKYREGRILERIESLDEVNRLALTFGRDVAETFRSVTLLHKPERNPSGYDLSDAPLIGLLTRIAKLLRLVCKFYELDNGDYISVFSRPLIESAIVATYLMRKGDAAIEDFRRCSYKDTLRILRDHENGSEFFDTAAGQRVLQAAIDDLALEGLSRNSFGLQKRNRWRLQGKSMYDIFAEVASVEEYPFVYGILSESIHGSWNQSMDWCLYRKDDGTFSTRGHFVSVDARAILPLVRYATPPYGLWLERIKLRDESLRHIVDRIQNYAFTIYSRFDELYEGPTAEDSATLDQSYPTAYCERTQATQVKDAIQAILTKYEHNYLKRLLASTPEADRLALAFYEDVAEILDLLSRVKNVERNPTGFSVDDAPILGLLVRTWKLLKLVIWIYKEESAEYAAIAARSLMEVAVTATYLLRSGGTSTMEDYRRCSYRNRLKILEQAAAGATYYRSKPGQRLLRSIRKKLVLEGLDENNFKEQIANGWRLEGKTFRHIFEEVMGQDLYAVSYGTSSESVHGSWQDIRGYSLQKDAVSEGFYPLYEPLRVNVGNTCMIIPFITPPFREWAKRVQLDDPCIGVALKFIDKLNFQLFDKYVQLLYGI